MIPSTSIRAASFVALAAAASGCGGDGDDRPTSTTGSTTLETCDPGLHSAVACPASDALADVVAIAQGAAAHFDATGELCPQPQAVPAFGHVPSGRVYVPSNVEGADCHDFGCEGWTCTGFVPVEPISAWYGYQYEYAVPWAFGVPPPGDRFAFDAWAWLSGGPIVYVRANFDATGAHVELDPLVTQPVE